MLTLCFGAQLGNFTVYKTRLLFRILYDFYEIFTFLNLNLRGIKKYEDKPSIKKFIRREPYLFYSLKKSRWCRNQHKMSTEKSGIFHLIYVNEKDAKDNKALQILRTQLNALTSVGIEEGISSINRSYRETLDDVNQNMFPRQTLTQVLVTLYNYRWNLLRFHLLIVISFHRSHLLNSRLPH